MKASLWNSIVEISPGLWLGYNSGTDSFIALRDSEAVKALRRSDVASIPATLLKPLAEIGMLVDKRLDEVSALKQLIEEIDNQKEHFQLIVNPTLDCNFRCWYCYESHIAQSKMGVGVMKGIERMVERILSSQPDLKSFQLSFFGGEPLLQFESVVKPLIAAVHAICVDRGVGFSLNFTTNGYLLDPPSINWLKRFSPSFQITLDGGKDQHDKTRFGKGGEPSYDRITSNIRLLASEGMRVILRINYTSENIESACGIAEYLEGLDRDSRKFVSVDFQRVWQDTGRDAEDEREKRTMELVRDIRIRLKKAGFGVSTHKVFNYVRDSCYADKSNEVLVNYNGDIFACTARDFLPSNRLGHLDSDGEIVWKNDSRTIRRSCRFSNPICHGCRIAPICGGGCRTKSLENTDSTRCPLGHTSVSIDNLILDRFEYYHMDAQD